jgi:hypothetical protein
MLRTRAIRLHLRLVHAKPQARAGADLAPFEQILRRPRRRGVALENRRREVKICSHFVAGWKRPHLAHRGQPDILPRRHATARLIRQVLGAISEFEKAMLVAKLRGARDRLGGPPQSTSVLQPSPRYDACVPFASNASSISAKPGRVSIGWSATTTTKP